MDARLRGHDLAEDVSLFIGPLVSLCFSKWCRNQKGFRIKFSFAFDEVEKKVSPE